MGALGASHFRRLGAATLLATTALATSNAADAQAAPTAAPTDPGEIIVTAQKRSENIQNVPISMQALGTETLAQHQVNNLDDYVKLLPSVSFQTYGPSQSDISFRGVATGGINLPQGSLPTVGVYIDEIPVSTIALMLDMHAYDMARVEALAGPQGTLYGASSLAGTLRLITNKPDISKFSAGYDLQLNKFGDGRPGGVGEGFVNMPLNDKIALRVVGFYDRDGGYISNTPKTRTYTLGDDDPSTNVTDNNAAFVQKDFNPVETYGGRVALGIDLDDNWTVTPTVIAQHQIADGVFGFDPRAGDLQVHEFSTDRNVDEWYLASLAIEGKIGNFDLHYSGSYLQRSVHNEQDYSYYDVSYDHIPGYTKFPDGHSGFLDPSQHYLDDQQMTKMSHELRLSTPKGDRLRATVGLFYQRQSDRNFAQYYVPGIAAAGDSPVYGDDVFAVHTHIVDRDLAAYGEANYEITSKLILTGGIRVFNANNTLYGFSGFASDAIAFGCTVPINLATCNNVNKSYKQTGETHKVNLAWQIDPDHMIYATYSTGFRPGGSNRHAGINNYKADTLDNFEIGWKTAWFDRKLRFNGAVFYEKWKNLQYTLAPIDSAGIVNIYNAGDAAIKGAEADLQYHSKGFTLSASAAYTNAKLTTNFCGLDASGNQDCASGVIDAPKGTRLPVQPRLKTTGTARYDFGLGKLPVFVQGSTLFQTGVTNFLATADEAPVGPTKPFITFDFSAGVTIDGIKFEAFIQNAFDNRGILSRNAFCEPQICGTYARSYPVKPQLFGLKASQRF